MDRTTENATDAATVRRSEKPELTQERLKQLVHYNPETGVLTRLAIKRDGTPRSSGQLGTLSNGYLLVFVEGKLHKAHRLVWLYMTGRWPEHTIDHKDGDRSNNRFANLRDVPHSVNKQNTKKQKGIEYRPNRTKPYRVVIKVSGKRFHIGFFRTESEAAEAREAAKCAMSPGYVPRFTNHASS